MIKKLLFNTRAGDYILRALEWLTGCILVPFEHVDGRYYATLEGVAACMRKR